MIYAEVIGDPVAQSKSPTIHKYWLEQAGVTGEYRKTRVAHAALRELLRQRRGDPDWRGWNVTIPHKQAVVPLLDRLEADASAVGAVNTIVPRGKALAGYNTDIDGIAAALDSTELGGRVALVIGAGGAARSLVAYLQRRGARIRVLARNRAKAQELQSIAPIDVLPLEGSEAFAHAAAIINASPLGMSGAEAMPEFVLDRTHKAASGATVFDMVTTPARTELLIAGEQGGGHTVDGLTMLIGQARRAFELFFGAAPPDDEKPLRELLERDSRDSA